MKISFLGTNGWYDTETGSTVSTLIETKKEYIILDAGNGIYRMPEFLKKKKPVYLFLSHFHFDHIIGLHILAKFSFPKGLFIFGQPGMKRILNKVINKPFTIPFHRLPFEIKVREIPEGIHHLPFLVKAKFLLHSQKCLGYRFEIDGKTIAYCTDTGLCKNAYELAHRADLLIAECSYSPGEKDERWPHLNPGEAACLAKQSKAKKLFLTHFDPSRYPNFTERKKAEKAARRIFENTRAARDKMEIILNEKG